MIDDEQTSLSVNLEGTPIDLGEDLLEKTAMIPGIPPAQSTPLPIRSTPHDTPDGSGIIVDQLQSAEILVREGLVEDAKKILHQILRRDPRNFLGKQLLKEIHEGELKQIFKGEEIRQPYGQKLEPKVDEVDSDILMRQLDTDLGLGIFLFENNEWMDEFSLELEKTLSRGSVQDWMDLGIGFLEMELYPVAVRLFSGACGRLSSEGPEAMELAVSATSLLAQSLILAGRPFEALSKMQPLLRDAEIKPENKIELFYLMGRTYESMKKFDFSFQFYRQVIEIDPTYRDTDRRMRTRMSE